jgi:hypothetical protein
MSEIARAVARGAPFHTDSTDFSRDYVGPRDLARLVRCLLVAAPGYRLVEAYSAGATTKSALLARLAREFALRWRISDGATTFSPPKPFKGLPLVHSAVGVGYVPSEASEETIVRELRAMWASPAERTARQVMS